MSNNQWEKKSVDIEKVEGNLTDDVFDELFEFACAQVEAMMQKMDEVPHGEEVILCDDIT